VKEILKNAEEALNGCIESDFERGFEIPIPANRKVSRGIYYISLKPHIAVAVELKRKRKNKPTLSTLSLKKAPDIGSSNINSYIFLKTSPV